MELTQECWLFHVFINSVLDQTFIIVLIYGIMCMQKPCYDQIGIYKWKAIELYLKKKQEYVYEKRCKGIWLN